MAPLIIHVLLLSAKKKDRHDLTRGLTKAQIDLCNATESPRACFKTASVALAAVTHFKTLTLDEVAFCRTQLKPRHCMYVFRERRKANATKTNRADANRRPSKKRQKLSEPMRMAQARSEVKASTARKKPFGSHKTRKVRKDGRRLEAVSTTRGLVVVATLGREENVAIVQESLKRFDSSSGQWDCLAYSHVSGLDTSRLRLPDGNACKVETRAGWKWASLLNLTTPLVVQPYDYVFVLLDDILLHERTFRVDELVRLQRLHGLSTLSPSVVAASRLTMSPTVSKQFAQVGCVRLVKAIEVFATLFTRRAWECFHEMFAGDVLATSPTSTGAVGWGYDLCYQAHCGARGLGGLGVTDSFMAIHTEGPLSELQFTESLITRKRSQIAKRLSRQDWTTDSANSLMLGLKQFTALQNELMAMLRLVGGYILEMRVAKRAISSPPSHRRLSLQTGQLHLDGINQMKQLRSWVQKNTGRQCLPSLPRVMQHPRSNETVPVCK